MEIKPITKEGIQQMLAEHKSLNPDLEIKPKIKESLDLYVHHGIPPGDFLLAVLSNNLFEALGRADSYNRATIFQITHFIINELPSDCWGSEDKINEYLGEFKKD